MLKLKIEKHRKRETDREKEGGERCRKRATGRELNGKRERERE